MKDEVLGTDEVQSIPNNGKRPGGGARDDDFDEPCDTFQRTGRRSIKYIIGGVIVAALGVGALLFPSCSGNKSKEPPHLGFNYTSNNSYVSR